MKQLCIALIVGWLIMFNGEADGRVVLNDSELLLKSDGEIIELYKSKHDGNSWLRMVLLFSRHTPGTNETHLEDLDLADPAELATTTTTTTTPKTTTTVVPIKQCQANFVLLGDHCYFFSNFAAKWRMALRICQALDSEFVHPENELEYSQIKTYLSVNLDSIPDWWMGGTDQYDEGQWVWSHDRSDMSYTDWYVGEPNNNEGKEDCMQNVEDKGYKWIDRSCDVEFQFICQKLPFTSGKPS